MAKFDESSLPVTLLCGILKDDGTVVKECTITAMTGGLRKQIAQPDVRKEGFKVMNAVLDACILDVGGEPFTASKACDKMLLADADYLLMKIRQHSLGDTITMDLTCPACSHSYRAELNISEIECYPIDDTNVEIIDGVRTFKLKTDNWDCVVRFPNRDDQKALAKISNDNPIQAMHNLYVRIMLEKDGEKVDGAELVKLFDDLPVKYIDELSGELEGVLPGVESVHNSTCPECGQQAQMEVNGGDFLFARPKGRTKSKSRIG